MSTVIMLVALVAVVATWYIYLNRLFYMVTKSNLPGYEKLLLTRFRMSLLVDLICAGLVVGTTVCFLVAASSGDLDDLARAVIVGCLSPILIFLSFASNEIGPADHAGPGWAVYTHRWTGRPTIQWINKGVQWQTCGYEWFVLGKERLAIDEVEHNTRVALVIEFEACPGLPLWQFGFLCAVTESRIRMAVVDLLLKGAHFPEVVKRLAGIEISPGIRGYLVGGRYHRAKVTHEDEYGDIRLPPLKASYTQMVIAPL